ncbi:MAG: response regulator [Gammaproteobacteria bacterium]|nr:response regulator [Gammaproteobacteria bacterium]
MNTNNSTGSSNDRPYVLVAEDSPTTRVVIERHLKQYFDLITAADGQEAWDLIRSDNNIELVITDINMPRMTGIELLQLIRSADDDRISSMPVFIMTSADDDEADKHQALDLGANDFITKPINPIVLRARVNVHHRLARATRELQQTESGGKPDHQGHFIQDADKFRETANHEVETAGKDNTNLSLLLVQIDLYDELRDAYSAGELGSIETNVGAQLARILRGIDTGAKTGDGQFTVLLPGTRRLGAAVVAERIRKNIEALDIDLDGKSASVTISVGLACISTEDAENYDALISICDKRVQLAQELGYNRICVDDEGRTNFSRPGSHS